MLSGGSSLGMPRGEPPDCDADDIRITLSKMNSTAKLTLKGITPWYFRPRPRTREYGFHNSPFKSKRESRRKTQTSMSQARVSGMGIWHGREGSLIPTQTFIAIQGLAKGRSRSQYLSLSSLKATSQSEEATGLDATTRNHGAICTQVTFALTDSRDIQHCGLHRSIA